ncbi:DUF4121 family protein [Phocaeicola dorei]|nr:DUF4121 family protein [Phocaeicola dorei]
MIQTTNKYSKETFIRLNYWYDRIHGLVQEDIDKVNTMVEHIEKTRSDQVSTNRRQPVLCFRLW